MKKVFICSRYAGDIVKNEATAERLCHMAAMQGVAPFAPHLFYTRFLDNKNPQERDLGLISGRAFLEACDELWVYRGDGVSSGMCGDIDYANDLGKPIMIIEALPSERVEKAEELI